MPNFSTWAIWNFISSCSSAALRQTISCPLPVFTLAFDTRYPGLSGRGIPFSGDWWTNLQLIVCGRLCLLCLGGGVLTKEVFICSWLVFTASKAIVIRQLPLSFPPGPAFCFFALVKLWRLHWSTFQMHQASLFNPVACASTTRQSACEPKCKRIDFLHWPAGIVTALPVGGHSSAFSFPGSSDITILYIASFICIKSLNGNAALEYFLLFYFILF